MTLTCVLRHTCPLLLAGQCLHKLLPSPYDQYVLTVL